MDDNNLTKQVMTRINTKEEANIKKAMLLSGRTQSDVIRRMIQLIDTPQGRAVLGIVSDPASEWQRDE